MLEWIVGIAAVLVLTMLVVIWIELLGVVGGLKRIERVLLGQSPDPPRL